MTKPKHNLFALAAAMLQVASLFAGGPNLEEAQNVDMPVMVHENKPESVSTSTDVWLGVQHSQDSAGAMLFNPYTPEYWQTLLGIDPSQYDSFKSEVLRLIASYVYSHPSATHELTEDQVKVLHQQLTSYLKDKFLVQTPKGLSHESLLGSKLADFGANELLRSLLSDTKIKDMVNETLSTLGDLGELVNALGELGEMSAEKSSEKQLDEKPGIEPKKE